MNPTIAVIALGAGALLISIEFCRPGSVVFGVTGGVLVVTAGYHLVLRDAGIWLAFVSLCYLLVALAAYGTIPHWVGYLATVALPVACWRMGAHPAVAAATMVSLAAATWWLLMIAARALQNKTLSD